MIFDPTMDPTSVPTQQFTSTETTDVSTTLSTTTPAPTVQTTDFDMSTTEEQKKKKQWKKYKSKSGKKYKWKSKSKSSGIRKKKYYYFCDEKYGNKRERSDGSEYKKCCECLNHNKFGGCEDRECERMICETDSFNSVAFINGMTECKNEVLPLCCDCSVRQRGKGCDCESDTICEEMICGKDSFC